MIGRLLCLIYLLTYSDTERTLLGSRWQFRVYMAFSDEDQILIENVYVVKVMEQKEITKEFLDKG